jgi:ABC-type polysaccharide/polyol phosphate export permease
MQQDCGALFNATRAYDRIGTRTELQGPAPGRWDLAWLDLRDALRQSWFWLALGWNDIVQRYRGSILGPLWLTLTTAVFVMGLGPLYGALFGLETTKYLPIMALGVLVWNFITGSINECCHAFIHFAHFMKQTRIPRLTLVFHILWRNIIVLLHNLPVVVGILLYCAVPLSWTILLAVPGLILVIFNLLWVGLLLAIVCVRFRDVLQIISSLLLLGFFFTPVMWHPTMHRVPHWVVIANPFASLIELVRAPLLGDGLPQWALAMAVACLAAGGTLTAFVFAKYRQQIILWV